MPIVMFLLAVAAWFLLAAPFNLVATAVLALAGIVALF